VESRKAAPIVNESPEPVKSGNIDDGANENYFVNMLREIFHIDR